MESLILAAVGASIGTAVTLLLFYGFTTSTLGANFTQVVFSFELTPVLVMQAVGLALTVGLIGGLFPVLAINPPVAERPLNGTLHLREHLAWR